MKTSSSLLLASILLTASVFAADAKGPPPPIKGSPELERIKALAGTWKGQADMGHGPAEITAEYRVVGNGSAVEERLFPNTPMEMVTIYHDRNGKLSLTHYCSVGNQPVMKLKSADTKSLQLELDPSAGIDASKAQHMNALKVTFDGPDAITQYWTMFDGGKAQAQHPFPLKRVKS